MTVLTDGTRANNVGIIAFDVCDAVGGAQRQALVTIENFSASSRTVPVEIRINDRLIDAHEVTVSPGESISEVFDNLRADSGGIIQVRLKSQNDLRADNEASVAVEERRPMCVLLVTEGSPFLERALNAHARDRTGTIRVQRPDGNSDTVSAARTAGTPLLFDRTDRVGVYRGAGATRKRSLYRFYRRRNRGSHRRQTLRWQSQMLRRQEQYRRVPAMSATGSWCDAKSGPMRRRSCW